jgi:hypothetical protein
VSIVGVAGLEKALAAGTQLSAQRQATYAALVEALSLSPTAGVDASKLDRATAFFAGFYAEAGRGVRSSAEIVLDSIEEGPGGAGFARMSKRARFAQLKRWLDGDPDAKSSRGHPWRAIAPEAVTLAALPFQRSEFDTPIMVAL